MNRDQRSPLWIERGGLQARLNLLCSACDYQWGGETLGAPLGAIRRQSGKNGDCNKSVVVLCGFLNCIITHAFQELTKVE